MTETISQSQYRYQVRFFPPIGQGQKFYFDNYAEAEQFIIEKYDALDFEKLPIDEIEKWKKDPFEEFFKRIHLIQIDKQLCPQHEQLFV